MNAIEATQRTSCITKIHFSDCEVLNEVWTFSCKSSLTEKEPCSCLCVIFPPPTGKCVTKEKWQKRPQKWNNLFNSKPVAVAATPKHLSKNPIRGISYTNEWKNPKEPVQTQIQRQEPDSLEDPNLNFHNFCKSKNSTESSFSSNSNEKNNTSKAIKSLQLQNPHPKFNSLQNPWMKTPH